MKETKGRGRPAGSTKKKDTKADKEDRKKSKLAVKEKPLKRQPKKERKSKDPNQPKRPPTAFFIFLDDFRKVYKEEHPDVKGVAAVGKAGGDKWKEMTDDEKAVYTNRAAQRRADYEKTMAVYNKKQKDEEESKENDEESIEEDEEEEEEEEE